MLRVHTRDGRTASIDLSDSEQAKWLASRLGDPRFQAQITAMTISHQGVSYAVARPDGLGPVTFLAELMTPAPDRKIKGGERMICLAGDVRASVFVHQQERAARVSLFRIGKQRYNPLAA
ncbi:hypothetical protein LCGC14_0334490 [marine sediment metagenome]|uniref:Uncharacterized protein n=1 Tax=marine sediment metagenome TaxID=412755 RepID=A0A0F9W2Q7_9ZZZZ